MYYVKEEDPEEVEKGPLISDFGDFMAWVILGSILLLPYVLIIMFLVSR